MGVWGESGRGAAGRGPAVGRLANGKSEGQMKVLMRTRAALAVAALLMASCSLPSPNRSAEQTQTIQDAIDLGIALTRTAEQALTEAAKGSQQEIRGSGSGSNSGASETQAAEASRATDTSASATNAAATQASAAETANAPTATPPPSDTPRPTATQTEVPTATRTATRSAPPTPSGAVVNDAYQTIRTLASLNDSQTVQCDVFVERYDHLVSLPATFNNELDYERARAHVIDTSRDEAGFCRAFLAGTNTSNTIPFLQWGLSRDGTDTALNMLRPVVIKYGFTP